MRGKKYFLAVFVTLGALIVFIAYMWQNNHKMKLTEEEQVIVKIATDKAVSLGYKPDELRILYDRDNKEWNGYWNDIIAREDKDKYKNLTGRAFQAVCFYPKKKHTLGGSVWILLDKESKEVILVQREK